MLSIDAVVSFVVYLVVIGLVFWLLWFLLNYINPPEPFNKVGRVVLMVAAVLVCIGALLSLAGHPILR